MTHDPGARFRSLHRPGDPFILANAWDTGSARVLAALGAAAIGTTSAGHAFTLGRPDMGRVGRDEALAHAEALVAATPLPVSADLENGYGPAPEDVAETVRLAAEAGLAGCSVEDTDLPGASASSRPTRPMSGRPRVKAWPADVVPIASAPSAARTRAEPASQALARMKGSPGR